MMIPLFSPPLAALVYGVLIALALVVVKERGWERVDRGGYPDSFRTRDKLHHFGLSFVLAFMAPLLLGVSLPADFILTLAAGIGWELCFCDRWSHRWRDIVVDAAGAALGVVLLGLGAGIR